MAVLSTLTVAALAVAGSLNGNIVVKEPFNFYDPLGYTEYNLINETERFSYNDYISEIIEQDNISSQTTVHVLTHGMGGDATHWLALDEINNDIIKVDFSLPFALLESDSRRSDYDGSSILNNSNQIYKIKYIENNIAIYKLKQNEENPNIYSFTNTGVDFDDQAINSQIVLIYEGPMGDSYNYLTDLETYECFEETLNTALSGLAGIFNGTLPQINLIGHSRGGLINLLYAYNYPEIVNNLISLGTPYVGSDWASAFVFLNKYVENDSAFIGYDDMLEEAHPYIYKDYLESVNDSVNSFAIGFNQTLEYQANSLMQMMTGHLDYVEVQSQKLFDFFQGYIPYSTCEQIIVKIRDAFLNRIAYESDMIENNLIFDFAAWALNLFGEITNDELSVKISNFINCIDNILTYDIQKISSYEYNVNSDFCVNLNSQLGISRSLEQIYNFDERIVIQLGDSENDNYYDYEHCSAPTLQWVAHNFETKSPTAIEEIISFLNENNGFHEHIFITYINDNSHEVKCYCGIASLVSESHTMVFEQNDELTHRHYCYHQECSYQYSVPHVFEYNNILGLAHDKHCDDCGYFVENEEHLINVYVSDGLQTHKVYCACGKFGFTDEHTVSAFTGNCTLCGAPITTPEIPPVFPPVGPNPIF